jgi:hypothetical protein
MIKTILIFSLLLFTGPSQIDQEPNTNPEGLIESEFHSEIENIISKGYLLHGQRVGIWKNYNQIGNLVSEIEFESNKIVELRIIENEEVSKIYYPNFFDNFLYKYARIFLLFFIIPLFGLKMLGNYWILKLKYNTKKETPKNYFQLSHHIHIVISTLVFIMWWFKDKNDNEKLIKVKNIVNNFHMILGILIGILVLLIILTTGEIRPFIEFV